MNRAAFETMINGRKTDLYRLENEQLEVWITNYGCRIVSLQVKDSKGKAVDVVVGFDSMEGYLKASEVYHGAVIGRYANRIAKGKFSLDGKEYSLATNNGPNHLHGGEHGFHNQAWNLVESGEDRLRFSYLSPDGQEGYPGNLEVEVIYTLSGPDLDIEFRATTDKPTVLNLTNHAYFNLNGQGSGSVLEHKLHINADRFTPIDETLIPYGTEETVEGTPFDFRQPETIGRRIDDDHQQIAFGKGYDHNYVLNKSGKELSLAARAEGDRSGIVLEVYTEEPGMQLYTGNFMEGKNTLKGGFPDEHRSAFCLETQHYPDSPNRDNFPTVVLRPEEEFVSRTRFKFVNR